MDLNSILTVLWNVIKTIQIWDIIDVTIVAYVIYKLISFVRDTNSTNIIKGFFLLIAVLLISDVFQLRVLNFLLSGAFEIGIIALVVLFQPELRRFLEQFGKSNLVGVFDKKANPREIEAAITQTVMACSDLAKTRTGALIVFERLNNLDSYIKSGTIINSDTSADLLKNIFYPKTPLHDGAVIIRDARIAGAACMLPLSNNTNLSRDLGMRHRAGVGMSERTDAVVVIVSEETGSISVAVEGMIKRHLTEETFEKILRNELIKDDEPKVKGKNILPFFNSGDKQ